MPKSTGDYYSLFVSSGMDHNEAMVKTSQIEFLVDAYAETGREITEGDVEKLASLDDQVLDALIVEFQKEAGTLNPEEEGLSQEEANMIAQAVEKRADAWFSKIAAERGGEAPENDDGDEPSDDEGFAAKMEAEMRRNEAGGKTASFDLDDPKIAGFERLCRRDALDQLVASGMLKEASDGMIEYAVGPYETTRFARTLEIMHDILANG